MARYGNATDAKPRTTGKACESCGKLPETCWHRQVADGVSLGAVQRGQNRTKLDPYYAKLAGRPELANKMLCPKCREEISRIINDPACYKNLAL